MSVKEILFCILYIVFAILGITLIKISGQGTKTGLYFLNNTFSFFLILGIIFYGLSFLIFTFAISQMQISIVLPALSGINSVLIVIVGIMLFKERLVFGQIVGIALIIAGTFLVTSK